jgi:hypothetical protein
MENANCEVRIYDKSLNWINVVLNAESVQYSKELYDIGKAEFHIHPDSSGAFDLATRGAAFIINGDGRKSGIIRDFNLEETRTGAQFVIYGDTGNGITKQRLTVPPTAQEDPAALGWDKINADAETVIKHYASKNLTAAYNLNRNIPNLIIAPNQNRGAVFPWKSRYFVLSDELNKICSHAEIGYEIAADPVNKVWTFDVIEGTDRTTEQQEVSPVIFRMEYQNVDGYRYIEDYSNYRSTGYAGGAGAEENRLIYITGGDVSGIDRIETFLDCASAANITELIYYANQRMTGFNAVKTVESGALPGVFIYGKDFYLGDLVTVYISRLNIAINARITGVKEIWERSRGYTREIRFGGKVPNIFNILEMKLNNGDIK